MMMISLIHLLIAFSFYSLSLSKTTDQSCPKLDQHQACPFNGQPIDESNTKLIQVFMIFRHGARSWIQTYPSESIPISHWDSDGGLGQLTSLGKHQLANQGLHFKSHYLCDFQRPFNSSKTIARSTNYNRTMASVSSFLSTLFPNDTLPIKTMPFNSDLVLYAKRSCPRYKQLRTLARKSLLHIKLETENEQFLRNMSNLSGIANLSYYHMWEIADHMLVNEAHGLPIPSWIDENRHEINTANDHTFFIDFLNDEMGKLVAGGLLNNVVESIKSRVLGQSDMELFIYGVHDNYLAAIQKLLDTDKRFVNPNFGAGYVIELRRDCECGYYVRVMYKNDLDPLEVSFRKVNVGDCEHLCPLAKFLDIVKDKVVRPDQDEIDRLCTEHVKK